MSTPRPRPWRPVTTVVLAVLALGLLGVRVDAVPRTRLAPAPAAASPSPVGHGPAAGAVTALVTAPPGQDPLASVPPDFASVMGYTPVPTRMADGTLRLAKPTGACSVPGGGAPFGFRRACRVHDYGYDLLRYAHATGQHLTAEARRQLDAMFRHDLRAGRQAAGQGLGGAARDLVVELFATGVAFNSWRQHYGNPAREPLAGLALGLAAPVLAVAIHPRLLRRRGRDGAGQHGGSVTPVTAGVRWRRHARVDG